MSHGDRVTQLPAGFKVIAVSEGAPFAAIADEKRKFYAVQFHPEVVHTPKGAQFLDNFVKRIGGLKGDWTMKHFRSSEIEKIRAQVGKGRVICGLSGGVDSTVAAVLIHEAIGDQLTCIYVDHGLMRLNESERGRGSVPRALQYPAGACGCASAVHRCARGGQRSRAEAQDDRPAVYRGVRGRGEEGWRRSSILAQGTLYPDVIESVSFTGGPSVTIKSHHNVGGLPEKMNLKLVEPLRELFKDEVRALGRELGLPEAFVGRHPFPGPGLAIRIPGEVTEEKLEILRKADAVYLDVIRKAGLYDKIWQAFAVLLPVRTVGVMGDGRTYDHVCALARGHVDRRHDGRLFPVPARGAGDGCDPHHQRGQRHQPRGLRHHVEAAGHDRVGVNVATLLQYLELRCVLC